MCQNNKYCLFRTQGTLYGQLSDVLVDLQEMYMDIRLKGSYVELCFRQVLTHPVVQFLALC